jgi:PAS domain S-box-containing protein
MRGVRRGALLLLLAAVYFAAGQFGLSLAFLHRSASAVWPPTGIAIAACLLFGPGVWPAILLGAFLVNLAVNGGVIPSLLIACGNTAEMLTAGWLVRRFAGGTRAFERTSTLLIYTGATALAAVIAATIGLIALVTADMARSAPPRMIWLTWWTGDLSGALLVAPAIVAWARFRRGSRFDRWLEAALVVAGLLVSGYFVFGPSSAGVRGYPLMFVVLPVQFWAALRFGIRGSTFAMVITSAIAIAGTLEGHGPFARGSANESLLLLQGYLGVTIVVMLTLAAEVATRREIELEILDLNADLSRMIDRRTEELQRLHGRLVEAQEVAHVGSWEWDVVKDSIWWSDEMYRLYGLSPGSPIMYEQYVERVHPDDRALVQETVARSAQTGEPFTFEHRNLRPDGSTRTLHARGRVVLDDDGRAIRMHGVGHDITELKRAEEERLQLVREQAARREAEEANRMKDQFLATLSHELRTPVNALLGWSQLLKERPTDEALRVKGLDAIHRNVAVQAQLVSDILDVARIRSGTLSLESHPVAMSSIVNGALDILRPIIDSKQIRVCVQIPDEAVAVGDSQRLQQVFWNLLSNAAKFVAAGGVIKVDARVSENNHVEVRVEDDGPGIAESFLPYVFDQFRQADASLTREHGGLGLGLAISQQLVQLHGGTIAAENRKPCGACFTVRLPGSDVRGVSVRPAQEPARGSGA